MGLGRKRKLFVLVKSISQLYAEEVKALPPMNLRQRSLAISRIKAGLHARFWSPIAEMLDPNHRMATPGGAGLNFYSRGREVLRLQPYEMTESLALMKRHLGTPRLTFNIWFQLRPIYQNLLSEALTKVDMDLVACAVREAVPHSWPSCAGAGAGPQHQYRRCPVSF
jgi:hypothetical protein